MGITVGAVALLALLASLLFVLHRRAVRLRSVAEAVAESPAPKPLEPPGEPCPEDP